MKSDSVRLITLLRGSLNEKAEHDRRTEMRRTSTTCFKSLSEDDDDDGDDVLRSPAYLNARRSI